MKQKIKSVFMGLIFCCLFLVAFSGCTEKSDKVTSAEWDAAFDALKAKQGENFKVVIKAKQEAYQEEFEYFWSSELIGLSDGEKEYVKEKRTEITTYSDGETVTNDLIDFESYLKRTDDGGILYVFKNDKWLQDKPDVMYGSIVNLRLSQYQQLIYGECFSKPFEFVEYSKSDKGYVCQFLSGDGVTTMKCIYKLKNKKIISVSAEGIVDIENYNRKETVDFKYSYGKQEITLPQI